MGTLWSHLKLGGQHTPASAVKWSEIYPIPVLLILCILSRRDACMIVLVPPGLKSVGSIKGVSCHHPHFKGLFRLLEEHEVSLG